MNTDRWAVGSCAFVNCIADFQSPLSLGRPGALCPWDVSQSICVKNTARPSRAPETLPLVEESTFGRDTLQTSLALHKFGSST